MNNMEGNLLMTIPIRIWGNLANLSGAERTAWLERLPELLTACARHWQLRIHEPMTEEYAEMSYNYIAPATRADGSEAILKLCSSQRDYGTEREGLRHGGRGGSVQLLDYDDEHGALLLERVRPGVPLGMQPDDEENTRIAADMMRRFWQPVPAEHGLRSVEEWVGGLGRFRELHGGGTGPLPEEWIERAEVAFAELMETSQESLVLHGDLHHWNILSAERGDWLAIDTKGMFGDAGYDFGAFLGNYPEASCEGRDRRELIARRVEILAEELEIDRERVRIWGMVHSVLGATWCAEAGDDWRPSIDRAEFLASLA